MNKTHIVIIALLLGGLPSAVQAQQRIDLADTSIEDLLKIEVTSVSRKEEQLFKAPSAIYVLTAEDLQRSGATTIPEALRLVPGLAVAQIDSSHWAVTARGFNNLRANKLLVLVDGRSIYTPMFSGVYWHSDEVPIDDIERIEIIRGPGGTLWGANAVNGIINIITKPSRGAQGGQVTVGDDSQDGTTGIGRYGGRLGDSGHFRIGGRYFERGETQELGSGRGAGDQWHLLQGSFRADIRLSSIDSLMVAGDVTEGTHGQRFVLLTGVRSRELTESPIQSHGRSLVTRWTHSPSPRTGWSFQASYGEARQNLVRSDEDSDAIDLDFQHRFAIGRRQDFVWGLGQRLMADNVRNSFMVSFDPESHEGYLTNAFVQNEIALVPSRLNVTLGSKVEYHDVTGFNVQPNARVSWTPTARHNLWGAVSRAVRTPSRSDLGIRVNVALFDGPNGLPAVRSVFGNPEFRSESVTSYEAGYRVSPASRLQIDTAAFYGRYRDLRQDASFTAVESTPAPTHLVIGTRWENGDGAATSGIETLARWSVLPGWRIDGSYSWFRVQFNDRKAANPINANTPAHQWQVSSRLDLPRNSEFDTTIFWVDQLDAFHILSYTRVDARFKYVLFPGVSLYLVGQNLLDPSHQEFGDSEGSIATEVPRTVSAKLMWRF